MIRPFRIGTAGYGALCLTFLLVAVGSSVASRTVVDETGRAVVLTDHPHRIVCLVPSITVDVFAIGAGDDVIAVSDYVVYPDEARKKPSVGSIDDPSLETILALHPDLVLGTPQLNPKASLDKLESLGIPVFLVDPHGVPGILHTIASLGHATDRDAQASALAARLTQRIDAVRSRVQGKPVVDIFMPLSYDPVITIGKGAFLTEIVALAGGRSITDDLRQEWPQISMETVIARAPNALLMMRGGKTTLAMLKDRPGWNVLPAVRNGRVYYVDRRIELPSSIAIDALEDLAKEFHP